MKADRQELLELIDGLTVGMLMMSREKLITNDPEVVTMTVDYLSLILNYAGAYITSCRISSLDTYTPEVTPADVARVCEALSVAMMSYAFKISGAEGIEDIIVRIRGEAGGGSGLVVHFSSKDETGE